MLEGRIYGSVINILLMLGVIVGRNGGADQDIIAVIGGVNAVKLTGGQLKGGQQEGVIIFDGRAGQNQRLGEADHLRVFVVLFNDGRIVGIVGKHGAERGLCLILLGLIFGLTQRIAVVVQPTDGNVLNGQVIRSKKLPQIFAGEDILVFLQHVVVQKLIVQAVFLRFVVAAVGKIGAFQIIQIRCRAAQLVDQCVFLLLQSIFLLLAQGQLQVFALLPHQLGGGDLLQRSSLDVSQITGIPVVVQIKGCFRSIHSSAVDANGCGTGRAGAQRHRQDTDQKNG